MFNATWMAGWATMSTGVLQQLEFDHVRRCAAVTVLRSEQDQWQLHTSASGLTAPQVTALREKSQIHKKQTYPWENSSQMTQIWEISFSTIFIFSPWLNSVYANSLWSVQGNSILQLRQCAGVRLSVDLCFDTNCTVSTEAYQPHESGSSFMILSLAATAASKPVMRKIKSRGRAFKALGNTVETDEGRVVSESVWNG